MPLDTLHCAAARPSGCKITLERVSIKPSEVGSVFKIDSNWDELEARLEGEGLSFKLLPFFRTEEKGDEDDKEAPDRAEQTALE